MTGDGLQDIVLRPRRQRRLLAQPRPRPLRAARFTMRDSPAAARRATTRGGCCSATSTATGWPTSSTSTTRRVTAVDQPERQRLERAGRRSTARRRSSDVDAVRLADLHGTGMAGAAVEPRRGRRRRAHCASSTSPAGASRTCSTAMDNHLGAVTRVDYAPVHARSTWHDQATRRPAGAPRCRSRCRWSPGSRSIDEISGGTADHRVPLPPRLLGRRRARVPRLRPGRAARHRDVRDDDRPRSSRSFSPPTLTQHLVPPGPGRRPEFGDWAELDLRRRVLARRPAGARPARRAGRLLAGAARAGSAATRCGRCAGRSCAPSCTRSTAPRRPAVHGHRVTTACARSTRRVRRGRPAADLLPASRSAQRTTQWERGDDPMTAVRASPTTTTSYGRPDPQSAIAVPRGRDPRRRPPSGEPYLATHTATEYARRDDAERYIVDRVAAHTTLRDRQRRHAAACSTLRAAVRAGAGAPLRVDRPDAAASTTGRRSRAAARASSATTALLVRTRVAGAHRRRSWTAAYGPVPPYLDPTGCHGLDGRVPGGVPRPAGYRRYRPA